MQVAFYHAAVHLEVQLPAAAVYVLSQFPGVPIFFFLSGMLVTASLSRRSLPEYAIARARRVLPALWVAFALAVAMLVAFGQIGLAELSNPTFWIWCASQISVFQVFNPDIFRDFGVGVVNGSLWTIPVEIGFYAILPVVFWIARQRRGALTALLLLGACASFAIYEATRGAESTLVKIVGFSPAAHFWLFAIGAIAFLHIDRVDKGIAMLRRVRGGWLLPLVAYCAFFIWVKPVIPATVATLFGTLMLAAIVLSVGLAAPARAAVLRGNDLSYGIYLYHMLVVNAAVALGFLGTPALLATLGISVGIAALSWRWIESTALRRGRPQEEHSPVTSQSVHAPAVEIAARSTV